MASVVRIAAILAISAAAGAVQQVVTGHPWLPDVKKVAKAGALKAELESRHPELRKSAAVTYDEFQRRVADGAVVLDARPASEFEKAHLSVEGPFPVLNVEPESEKFYHSLDRLMPFRGQPILIYCTSDTCELGEELYLQLEKNDFFDMKIYFPGWEGLAKAGVKSASGPDTWTVADSQAAMGHPAENAEPPADEAPPAEQP